MKKFIAVIRKELENLEAKKTQSTNDEVNLIHKPFGELKTLIKESNAAAKKKIEAIIRTEIVKWKSAELRLISEQKALKTLSLSIFGISDPKLLQEKMSSRPEWYNRLTKKRKEFNELERKIAGNNEYWTNQTTTTNYLEVAFQEEEKQIQEAIIQLEQQDNNNDKIEKLKEAKEDKEKTEDFFKKIQELEDEITNLRKKNSTPKKTIKEKEQQIKYWKEEIKKLDEKREKFYISFNKEYNEKLAGTIETELKAMYPTNSAATKKKIQEEKNRLLNARKINLQTANYLKKKIEEEKKQIIKLNNQGKIEVFNPKNFTEATFKKIIMDWNRLINRLEKEHTELLALKATQTNKWTKILATISNSVNDTSVITLIEQEYANGIVYKDEKNQEISEEQYLKNLSDIIENEQKIVNDLQPIIKAKTKELTNGNLTLNKDLSNWISKLNLVSKRLEKLQEHSLDHSEDYSFEELMEISDLETQHAELETSLKIFQDKTALAHNWIEILPTQLPESERSENGTDLQTLIETLPRINTDIVKNLRNMFIGEDETDEQNNGMAFISNRKLNVTIAGQKGEIEWPVLQKVPSDIKTLISASGTIAIRDDSQKKEKPLSLVPQGLNELDSGRSTNSSSPSEIGQQTPSPLSSRTNSESEVITEDQQTLLVKYDSGIRMGSDTVDGFNNASHQQQAGEQVQGQV